MASMTKRMVVALAALCVFGSAGSAQMVDPAIDDPREPFCYFAYPTDVLGVMDGPEGTLVSPEGYLYTGSAELMFFTGNPPRPVNQRVKTLRNGYLPVIEYRFAERDVAHEFTLFATTLTGKPDDPLVNLIRVRIHNGSSERKTVFFSTGLRYQNDANTNWGVGDNRFGRPAVPERAGSYAQSGVEFSMDWEYSFQPGAVLRDGKVMYLFPESFPPERMMTLKTGYNEVGSLDPEKLYVLPTTPVGIVQYPLRLGPGESLSLEFAMPYEPFPADSPLMDALRRAHFDQELEKAVARWEELFATGLAIDLPEEKVVNTYKANLVYDLIARDKIGDDYIQKVNEFQYDSFWLRDAAYIVRMYDVSGYHAIARQCLEFFPRWQTEDGNFLSQGGQYDGWGQTLWAFGEHYRMTRDRGFAERVFPLVMKAVRWLEKARASDPYGLMPETTPGDNELITGHVTGHNFWALIGLRNAVHLAQGLGKTADAASLERLYSELRASVLQRLKVLTPHSGGAIPPGLDSLGGQDWGNMMGIYPELIFDPMDPMVAATLEATRAKYKEGLMTYGDGRWLHHYLTMKNTESELIRGEQEQAIRELYAVLMHTSATHAGFEFSIMPWATRDFGMNLAPHGWFSATYRTLLRNMLVREQGDEVHLLSAVSPRWCRNGDTIAVRRAPTEFGTVHFTVVCKEGGADLTVNPEWTTPPGRLVLHIPWFVSDVAVRSVGERLAVRDGAVELPLQGGRFELGWKLRGGVEGVSYEAAVGDYQREYRRRYEEFLREGTNGPGDRRP